MRRLHQQVAFSIISFVLLMTITVRNFSSITAPMANNSFYALVAKGEVDTNNPIVTNYIRSRLVYPSTRTIRLSDPRRSDFSEVGHSAFVDELLHRRRNGFFVECGAADGEFHSNTLFFELRRNWTGLLIEANPEYYRALCLKHRNAYSLHACLSIMPRPSTMKMRVAGQSGGLVETVHPFQTNVSEVVKGYDLDLICYPLNSILDSIGVYHVDFFSLDVEGAELGVLQTINWSMHRIDVISAEVHIGGLPQNQIGIAAKRLKYENIRNFMASTGLYKEVSFLPRTKKNIDLFTHDVVFMRTDIHVTL